MAIKPRNEIKRDMMAEAARMWNLRVAELEGADPLVELLFGATAKELEAIYQELDLSRSRILDRLAGQLAPDVLTGPLPAHAVAICRSSEPKGFSFPTDQFAWHPPITEPGPSLYFAPLQRYPILDATVQYMACGQALWQLEEGMESGLRVQAAPGKGLAPGSLWMGISHSAYLEAPFDARLYFDWKNDPYQDQLYPLLNLGAWFQDGQPLETEHGLPPIQPPTGVSDKKPLELSYRQGYRVRTHVRNYYNRGFITVKNIRLRCPLPEEIAQAFGQKLKELRDPETVWLELRLPSAFPAASMPGTGCYLNAIPVANLQFFKKIFPLNRNLNIHTLPCEGYFLEIEEVVNTREMAFRAEVGHSLEEIQTGFYLLRRQGFRRFDGRDARQMMQHLIDQMRDEVIAFSAWGHDMLQSQLQEMNQLLNRMQVRLDKVIAEADTVPVVIIRPFEEGEMAYVSYWATQGAAANRLSGATPLAAERGDDIEANTVRLVTRATGGRDPLSPAETLNAYRAALQSRDQLITREDIRQACIARMGSALQNVEVSPGVRQGHSRNRGLIRSIEVSIRPARGAFDAEVWPHLGRDLEAYLNRHSSGLTPVFVNVQNEGA